MAKFTKASDEIQEIVNEVSNELGFAHLGVDFEALSVEKAKDVVTVSKASKITEYLSNREDLVLVFCLEDAFDAVDEKTRYMWIRMAMDQITYDYEKAKVNIGVPSITVPVGFWDKYKNAAIESALLGQTTIAQIEEKRKEEKVRKSAQKRAKKQQN